MGWVPFQASLLKHDMWHLHFNQAMLRLVAHSHSTTCWLDILLLLHGSVGVQCENPQSTNRNRSEATYMLSKTSLPGRALAEPWQNLGRSYRRFTLVEHGGRSNMSRVSMSPQPLIKASIRMHCTAIMSCGQHTVNRESRPHLDGFKGGGDWPSRGAILRLFKTVVCRGATSMKPHALHM